MGYNPAVGIFVERDPVEADPNAYRYVGNNSVIYVDPSGKQQAGGVTKTGTDYDSVFDSAAMGAKTYRLALLSRDTIDKMLLGTSAKCEESITLPPNLQLALQRAVEKSKASGNEWGGMVSLAPDGRYVVWGPVEGNDRDVRTLDSVYPLIFAKRGTVFVGEYHVHPHKDTAFSGGDVTNFLTVTETPISSTRNDFIVMANCDGTDVRALVRLAGDPTKTGTTRLNPDKHGYTGKTYLIEGLGPKAQAWGRQWHAFYDNSLAEIAGACRFCFYRGGGVGKPLKLAQYNDKMPVPPFAPPPE